MNRNSHPESRLRDRLRSETARAIADAAEEVFAAHGVRDARMEEIAARAGVAVGTVYNHFEDRSALFAELVERRRQELAGKLDAAFARAKGEPFAAQLRRFALTVFEHFETHAAFLSIMLESDSAHAREPSPAMLELRRRVDGLVERGIQERAVRRQGRELWPAMLFGAVRGVLIHELRNPGKLALAQRADAVCDFFLHGAAV
ncbi:MAG TPA: TetR/AcrR family transcriptional regulator [Myxococcales bacterium]|nr:TetR/AcrR family transcriptional regulator [Myxococcales bacterium]